MLAKKTPSLKSRQTILMLRRRDVSNLLCHVVQLSGERSMSDCWERLRKTGDWEVINSKFFIVLSYQWNRSEFWHFVDAICLIKIEHCLDNAVRSEGSKVNFECAEFWVGTRPWSNWSRNKQVSSGSFSFSIINSDVLPVIVSSKFNDNLFLVGFIHIEVFSVPWVIP